MFVEINEGRVTIAFPSVVSLVSLLVPSRALPVRCNWGTILSPSGALPPSLGRSLSTFYCHAVGATGCWNHADRGSDDGP